jgi:hypothetical protein
VPQYANKTRATWVVSEFTGRNAQGAALTVGRSELRRYPASLAATELVDDSPASHSAISLVGSSAERPAVGYVNGTVARAEYSFSVRDYESGFWKGSLQMRGPTGTTITTDFSVKPIDYSTILMCGNSASGDPRDMGCSVIVTFPAGSAAGQWVVRRLELVNNAGERSTYNKPVAPTFTLTSNLVVSASGFAADPALVDNWRSHQQPAVKMKISGAQNGVAHVYVDTDELCVQRSTTPSTDADGAVAVPLHMSTYADRCTVNGIAIVDGNGNVALYGTRYHAPDPHVVFNRMPDTTPPAVVAASLNRTAVPVDEATSAPLYATVTLASSLAPVNGYDSHVFDANGNVVGYSTGRVQEDPAGTVQVPFSFPYGIQPGTYTVGFTISDSAGLQSTFGKPWGQPMPGGPLQITVTPSQI